MVAAVVAAGLQKVYRNGRGLLGLDLTVQAGEILGFLGPNGAGKTTTIRTLMGFLRPTGGTARILDCDVAREGLAVRRQVGYLPSDPALYDHMTGRQHLDLVLSVRGVADRRRVTELAERLGAELDRRCRQLSRGNRQKVAILLALAHDPPVLILDEPSTGLDPLVQDAFHRILQAERERGKTVFFSSHVLPEVEAISDRVGIIKDGRLVAVDTVAHLRGRRLKRVVLRHDGTPPDLQDLPGLHELTVTAGQVKFAIAGNLGELFRRLAEHPPADATITEPSLEEVFHTFYAGDTESEAP